MTGFDQSQTRIFPALASGLRVGKALVEEDLTKIAISAAPAAGLHLEWLSGTSGLTDFLCHRQEKEPTGST